jgi:hypothetical protein
MAGERKWHIVDVVFGITPDGRESWHARGSGSAGQRPLLLAQTNEIHEMLDLGNALSRQRLDFLDQGMVSAGMSVPYTRLLVAFYQQASPLPIPRPAL